MVGYKNNGDTEFETIILQAPMGICLIDARTLIIEMANNAFVEVAGKPLDHMVGHTYWDTFAEAAPFYEKELQRVIEEGRPFYANEVQLMLMRHGQEENIWVTFVYMPVKTNGEVLQVAVYVLENTRQVKSRHQIEKEVAERTMELEKSQTSLLSANVYLQRLLNLSDAAVQVLEPIYDKDKIIDFRYKITNKAYAAYANTQPELLVGKAVSEVFPGYFQTSSFVNVVNTFLTGVADSWEIHYNLDELDIYNQMSATKIGEEVVVQFTEITKLKKLQLEMESNIEELERSNQNLEEFAHAASHDLKEPIRKVKTFTNMLKDQLSNRLSETEIRTFDRIENAVERMRSLVDDLLTYSQVSMMPVEKQPVDLNKELQFVREDLELYIEEKKVIIEADHLPVIQGYKRQVQQLLQNLISNAIKYGKSGQPPHIKITSSLGDHSGMPYHTITITDNGIGFEPEFSEQIFKLFTRLHGKDEYGGTGIGLSIVRKVAENHNGFVSATGNPGKGASFSILLPA